MGEKAAITQMKNKKKVGAATMASMTMKIIERKNVYRRNEGEKKVKIDTKKNDR